MIGAPLILASSSRYRRALLERLGIEFEVDAPRVDEDAYKGLGYSPELLARTLAESKARDVAGRRPGRVIVASDQVAELGGQVFDKPVTHEAAVEQLQRLSGQSHHLHTAMTLIDSSGHAVTDLVTVTLRMRALSPEAVTRYLRTDEPYDCCGSYRIEARGIALFESIEMTDATAIEGLPLITLVTRLREAGLQIP